LEKLPLLLRLPPLQRVPPPEQLVVLVVDLPVVELEVVLLVEDLPVEADPVDQVAVMPDLLQPSMLLTRNTRTVVVAKAIVGRFGRRSGSTLWISRRLVLPFVQLGSHHCFQRLWWTVHIFAQALVHSR
jgi:hypothetical protein